MLADQFHRRGFGSLIILFLCFGTAALHADENVTREYILKNVDSSVMIRVLNVVIPNPKGKRLMGGNGKQLVVTDTPDEQAAVLELLPILDQTSIATNPDRMAMEMMQRGLRYLQRKERMLIASKNSGKGLPPAASAPVADSSGVHSYDAYTSTRSIYAEEDAKLVKDWRIIEEEGGLPSLADLTLKGIFKSAQGASLGLLVYGNINYVARDGGLFEKNRSRVKEVTSKVMADRVILTGPDRLPREYKFKSTL